MLPHLRRHQHQQQAPGGVTSTAAPTGPAATTAGVRQGDPAHRTRRTSLDVQSGFADCCQGLVRVVGEEALDAQPGEGGEFGGEVRVGRRKRCSARKVQTWTARPAPVGLVDQSRRLAQ